MSFIVEPHQTSTEPLVPDIDRYTSSNTYEYILEMDANGTILGGEWIGYSRTSHPDFLWLPLRPSGGNPHVDIEKVRMLLQMAVDPDDPEQPVEMEEFASNPNLAIPDDDPQGVTDTIEVSQSIEIGTLKVAVEIDHTYIGDLRVLLERDGVMVPLHDRQGGGADDLHETFDVTQFVGQSAAGTWRLHVSDHAGRDLGVLRAWRLLVSTQTTDPSTIREYSAQGLPVGIPDDNPTGIDNTISVTDTGTLGQVQIVVDITHTYVGDLTVTIAHNGATQVLHSREGGSSDDIDKTYTATAFNGGPLAGDWTLHVRDEAGLDVGQLVAWRLRATLQ